MNVVIPEIEQQIIEPKIPHLLKYMGSKREILDFVIGAIKELNVESEWFCDLFAGTSVVGASLKGVYKIHSNDIQSYSALLAKTYLSDLKAGIPITRLKDIKVHAQDIVNKVKAQYPDYQFIYSENISLEDAQVLEEEQQDLINQPLNHGFHLYAKNYSGTYWSYEQCLWIDALRCVAERYKDQPEYYAIMASLISAMSYTTQSTGHYAQYRDLTEGNLKDILGYRNRTIWTYFERKFTELITVLNGSPKKLSRVTTLDYIDCLSVIDEGTIVYADPPYQSVHYSRFYHALETLVRYDYPSVSHKGRYREDRHQSPFCKHTTVKSAFNDLFSCVKERKSHLALSYSDTGMISLEQITTSGRSIFKDDYTISVLEKDHIHSKMGRSDERQQGVKEYIILFKRK